MVKFLSLFFGLLLLLLLFFSPLFLHHNTVAQNHGAVRVRTLALLRGVEVLAAVLDPDLAQRLRALRLHLLAHRVDHILTCQHLAEDRERVVVLHGASGAEHEGGVVDSVPLGVHGSHGTESTLEEGKIPSLHLVREPPLAGEVGKHGARGRAGVLRVVAPDHADLREDVEKLGATQRHAVRRVPRDQPVEVLTGQRTPLRVETQHHCAHTLVVLVHLQEDLRPDGLVGRGTGVGRQHVPHHLQEGQAHGDDRQRQHVAADRNALEQLLAVVDLGLRQRVHRHVDDLHVAARAPHDLHVGDRLEPRDLLVEHLCADGLRRREAVPWRQVVAGLQLAALPHLHLHRRVEVETPLHLAQLLQP
eukprot:Rhum_TRINITY_DN13051_c0_g1::Rhum_TRINITY_DN13051_c0_g1_i1::g.56561::m.56561